MASRHGFEDNKDMLWGRRGEARKKIIHEWHMEREGPKVIMESGEWGILWDEKGRTWEWGRRAPLPPEHDERHPLRLYMPLQQVAWKAVANDCRQFLRLLTQSPIIQRLCESRVQAA